MNLSEFKIFNIIKEEIEIFESDITSHGYKRIDDRLRKMVSNNDITSNEANFINNNLKAILNYDFKPNKSYGIMLGRFRINPESFLLTKKHGSGDYYEILSNDENDIVKDSTGNEFWGVVRNNRLITVFLRKTIQRQTADNPRDLGGLGVDVIIDDFNKYLQNIQKEKDLQRQKELEKLQKRILNINGILWIVDEKNQLLYKKNNSNIFVTFDNLLDYPEWNDKTKEELLNILAPVQINK